MTSKPKLGQNFLADPAAAYAIVQALGDISAGTVLEIGPGKGAITSLLAARAGHLVAVDLDASLAARLTSEYAMDDRVEVLHHDILTLDMAGLLPNTGGKLAVVGNLPYYITSPILLHLFEHANVIDRAVIMVQREVADRIAAAPGTRDYGLLTATTQLFARVENLFTLPPSAFSPPPEVYSTVLRLTFASRLADLGIDRLGFIKFLKESFAQKRKTLANNLRFAGHGPENVAAAFRRTGISSTIRAEALPLEEAARLYRDLQDSEQSAQ
ncbi:SSU rRNA (adenine(1518)-N(6)/adenine(1519)-N(6))-dimethyltransferase [Acidisarcina polymorpha]|uniref:Ribosomal RNA small subunit methyltransferase A n=1 Tax=Acidisarcina polymorpha TaxID=2211140 RepID=A0A2Z5G5I1_9BACT|nr:16S rRNA (adenine(1518)-N(6)/adenine(1519)-N(6))-dimethyltransferase RsmA [Acidisarcina polymorpha]AXC14240.1 SSU rRNA (adenine(1518)-N(6)/adenine(1519)-N(6))-dimethyltransferase [Acidisarcina polymorpha]